MRKYAKISSQICCEFFTTRLSFWTPRTFLKPFPVSSCLLFVIKGYETLNYSYLWGDFQISVKGNNICFANMSSFSIDHLAKYVFRQLYGFFVLQRDLTVDIDQLSWTNLEEKLLDSYFPERPKENKWELLKEVIRKRNMADNVKNFVLRFYKQKLRQ